MSDVRNRETAPIDVVVVGDALLTTELLVAALVGDDRFRVVVRAALRDGTDTPVDCVVVVVGGPGWDLRGEVTAAAERDPSVRIVVVASYIDPRVVEELEPFGAVVRSTEVSLGDLLRHIAGGSDRPAAVDRHDAPHLRFGITDREAQTLHLLAEGVTPQQIALRLGIRPYTVRDHLSALRRKLDCATAVELVVTAHRLGLAPHVGRPLLLERPGA